MNFSIIVTVYNKEKYLNRCMESILQDKTNDYEIIVIYDGSTDSSSEILLKYKNKYKNIKLYSQTNEGIGKTRKKSLTLVNGRYVIFVDADDTIEKDLLKNLRKSIIEFDYPDIIKYNIREIDSLKNPDRLLMNKSEVVSGIEALYKWNSNFSIRYGLFPMYAFKTDLWKNNLNIFSTLSCYEDVCNITKILFYAKKIVILNYIGYNYYRNKDSVTQSNSDNFLKFKACCDIIISFYSEKIGKDSKLYKAIEKYYNYHLERKTIEFNKIN